VLRCLEQRGATDAERARILRMGVAADLAAGWADSARLRLARATGGSAGRERDLWVLLAHATGLPALGDWHSAAERVRGRLDAAADTDAVAHWLLARLGVDRSRHDAALRRPERAARAGRVTLAAAAGHGPRRGGLQRQHHRPARLPIVRDADGLCGSGRAARGPAAVSGDAREVRAQ